jgi:hypothetical protein
MTAAVLTEIGSRTVVAEGVRGTVIIGEGAGQGPGTVVVQIADRVWQRVVVRRAVIAVVVPGFRRTGRYSCREEHNGGKKPGLVHVKSPEIPIRQLDSSGF